MRFRFTEKAKDRTHTYALPPYYAGRKDGQDPAQIKIKMRRGFGSNPDLQRDLAAIASSDADPDANNTKGIQNALVLYRYGVISWSNDLAVRAEKETDPVEPKDGEFILSDTEAGFRFLLEQADGGGLETLATVVAKILDDLREAASWEPTISEAEKKSSSKQ